MKLRTRVLFYITCALLTACGVTAADSGTSGYTYVSSGGNNTMPYATIASHPTTGTTTTAANADSNTPAGTTTAGGSSATTTGGSTTSGATGTTTTTAGTPTGTPTPTQTYTVDDLTADMNNVLQSHTPIYSTQNLGNPVNVSLWSSAPAQSLYDGLLATQAYYPNLSLQDLSHLMLALGATDSTGDYRLSNGSAVGYLQVSTNSAQTDYTNHGVAITGPDGQLISPTSITLTTPGANVAIMAWYTRNAVSSGESANEAAAGQHNHVVTRDVGNGILSWLVGPGSDRHNLTANSDAANRWPAFYNRILDYYVQGGFGNQASFDAILNTSMPSTLQGFKDAPAGAFP